jgi:hypothetical protein
VSAVALSSIETHTVSQEMAGEMAGVRVLGALAANAPVPVHGSLTRRCTSPELDMARFPASTSFAGTGTGIGTT